jgi:arsenate reductase
LNILFLSRRDGGRGPMAARIARQLLATEHKAVSAGVESGLVHPLVAECLAEIGLELGAHKPRVIEPDDLRFFDLVVVVCERDIAGPLPRGVRKLHWPLVDPLDPPAPKAELVARFRDIRTALEKHIKGLIKMDQTG